MTYHILSTPNFYVHAVKIPLPPCETASSSSFSRPCYSCTKSTVRNQLQTTRSPQSHLCSMPPQAFQSAYIDGPSPRLKESKAQSEAKMSTAKGSRSAPFMRMGRNILSCNMHLGSYIVPFCAREALQLQRNLCVNRIQSSVIATKHMKYTEHIVGFFSIIPVAIMQESSIQARKHRKGSVNKVCSPIPRQIPPSRSSIPPPQTTLHGLNLQRGRTQISEPAIEPPVRTACHKPRSFVDCTALEDGPSSPQLKPHATCAEGG